MPVSFLANELTQKTTGFFTCLHFYFVQCGVPCRRHMLMLDKKHDQDNRISGKRGLRRAVRVR